MSDTRRLASILDDADALLLLTDLVLSYPRNLDVQPSHTLARIIRRVAGDSRAAAAELLQREKWARE